MSLLFWGLVIMTYASLAMLMMLECILPTYRNWKRKARSKAGVTDAGLNE